MKHERQMAILRERHGINTSAFEHTNVYGVRFERLCIGGCVLEGRSPIGPSGVDVWDTVHEPAQRLHNWVAAVTYAKAREAARRVKEMKA